MADNWLRIRVTKVVDPGNFVGQIGTDETFSHHDMLEESISKYCEQVSDHLIDVEDLEALESRLVLVKSLQHLKWVRGIQINTDSDTNEVDVIHIDYGTSEIVPLSHVVAIVPEEFMEESWPRQGVTCGLADVKPIGSNYIQRTVNLFKSLVERTMLDCEVVSSPTDHPVMLKLYVMEESGEGRYVSDILVSEGVARPTDASASYTAPQEKKMVPQFDLSKLARRLSSSSTSTSVPVTPISPGDDLELKELKSRLGGGEAYNYESSDKTIGQEYRPNVPIDMLENIFSQISALHQDIQPPIEVEKDPELVEASKKLERLFQSDEKQNRRQTDSPSRRATLGSQLGKPSERTNSSSPGRRVGRGRGSARRDLMYSPVAPGRSHEPPVIQDSSDSSGKLSSPRKIESSKIEIQIERLTGEQLEKEYEWQKYQLERKIDSTLSKRREEPAHVIVTELMGYIYPAKSWFSGLPGRDEVYICLHKLIVHVISCPSYLETVLGVIELIRDYPKFPDDISELLWSLHDEYVVLYAEGSTVSAKNYSKFLGRLYVMSGKWEDSRDNIFVCVCNILDKWEEALLLPKTGHISDRQVKLYSDCVETLIKTCGQKLAADLPSELESLLLVVRRLILSKTIIDSLLNLYGMLCTLTAENEEIGQKVNNEDKGHVEVAERSSQTYLAELEDAEVQTELEELVLCKDSGMMNGHHYCEDMTATEFGENDDFETDEYVAVRVMLTQLKMINMLETFMENAVRDCTLHLEFADLKELLKECGLKAGAIYEIRAYLSKKANEETFSTNSVSRKSSVKSSVASDDGRSHTSVGSGSTKSVSGSAKSVSSQLTNISAGYRNGSKIDVTAEEVPVSKSLAELAADFGNPRGKESNFDQQSYDSRGYVRQESESKCSNGSGDHLRLEKQTHNADSPTVVFYSAPEPPLKPGTPSGRPELNSRSSSRTAQRSVSEESDADRPVYMQPMLAVKRLSNSRGHPISPGGVPFIQPGHRHSPLSSPDEQPKYYRQTSQRKDDCSDNYRENYSSRSSYEREPYNGDYRNSKESFRHNSEDKENYGSFENRRSKTPATPVTPVTPVAAKPMGNSPNSHYSAENVDWFDVDFSKRSRKNGMAKLVEDKVKDVEDKATADDKAADDKDSSGVRKRCNVISIKGIVSDWILKDTTPPRQISKESSLSPDTGAKQLNTTEDKKVEDNKVNEKVGRRKILKKMQLKKLERNSPRKTENVPDDMPKAEEGPQSYAGVLVGRESRISKPGMLNGDSGSFDSDAYSNDPLPAFSSASQKCTMCGSAEHTVMTCPERRERFLLN